MMQDHMAGWQNVCAGFRTAGADWLLRSFFDNQRSAVDRIVAPPPAGEEGRSAALLLVFSAENNDEKDALLPVAVLLVWVASWSDGTPATTHPK